MNLDRQELEKQREHLRSALAWVEARMAELDGDPQASAAKEAAHTVRPPSTTPQPFVPHAPPDDEQEDNETTGLPFTPGKLTPAAGLTPGTKIGCIAGALIVIILTILLLFVLPFFLYRDDEPAPESRSPAQSWQQTE